MKFDPILNIPKSDVKGNGPCGIIILMLMIVGIILWTMSK